MDFAEDYKCSDKTQQAYWNMTFITIHPTATFFKQNNSLAQQGGRFCRLFLWCRQKICLGKLQEIDYNGEKVLISFMSPDMLNSKMQSFRWPIHADELWVKRNSIFINIPLHGRKKRDFRISQEVLNNTAIQYQVHLHNSSFNSSSSFVLLSFQ